MKNKRIPRKAKDSFSRRLDALLPRAEELSHEEVLDILAASGFDGDAVIEKAFRSLQELAGRRYLSRGEDAPAELGEALRQLRPASPRERVELETERARTAIRSIFDKVKRNASAIASPGWSAAPLQPAFRNKKDLSEADRRQLAELQDELDGNDEISEK